MAGSTATGLARRGVDCISRGDRVHYSQCADRIDSLSWVNKSNLRAHEDGVMSFIGQFLGVGLPAAAGWRSWEHLGGSGGISPDGLVFLTRSPFGPTWAYFEYERSARGEARVGVLHGSWHDARMGALQRGQRQLDSAHLGGHLPRSST